MIQGIFTFQFVLNPSETGEIEPEFQPIQLIFRENEEIFTKDNYLGLLNEDDIFATFYQHTTGLQSSKRNFYTGRLRKTPYQIYSYYKQETDGSQFLIISIFEMEDEIELFEDLIKELATRIDGILPDLVSARNSKQISLVSDLNVRLANELKFAIFQIERLTNLDKLQKVALIYRSKERLEIMSSLREKPLMKEQLRKIVDKVNPMSNLDILIRPLLELNLIRRDWSKGERDKETGRFKDQGEFIFLTKDILLARVPSEYILNHIRESKNELFEKYRQKAIDFFSNYNPYTEKIEDKRLIAALLLNPDVYDFFTLLRSNYYPIDKIPKIFSDYTISDVLLNTLKRLNIITEIADNDNRKWIILLTDIKPLVIFPEYLLPKIRKMHKTLDRDKQITYEIARKAYDLLEVDFPEKVEF